MPDFITWWYPVICEKYPVLDLFRLAAFRRLCTHFEWKTKSWRCWIRDQYC